MTNKTSFALQKTTNTTSAAHDKATYKYAGAPRRRYLTAIAVVAKLAKRRRKKRKGRNGKIALRHTDNLVCVIRGSKAEKDKGGKDRRYPMFKPPPCAAATRPR